MEQSPPSGAPTRWFAGAMAVWLGDLSLLAAAWWACALAGSFGSQAIGSLALEAALALTVTLGAAQVVVATLTAAVLALAGQRSLAIGMVAGSIAFAVVHTVALMCLGLLAITGMAAILGLFMWVASNWDLGQHT